MDAAANAGALRARLLDWYDRCGRTLPWRIRPEDRARGAQPDPYRVWLSEIMLQQTTVAAVKPYYDTFLRLFPDVKALAAAPQERVLEAWAGLGYYARARNLHACARVVAAPDGPHGGRFPETEEALRALPGVGVYTAAAIAAVCSDQPTNVVDGNVERVIARVFAVDQPLPKAKPLLRDLAALLCDSALPGFERPGDYAQALMDLGATVCAPRSPDCSACPWSQACAARAQGDPQRYPLKTPKAPKPHRHGVSFVLLRDDAVWLRRRPAKGLLAAMAEPPGTTWRDAAWSMEEAGAAAPKDCAWRRAPTPVRHVFTHFTLELEIWAAAAPEGWSGEDDGWWAPVATLENAGLPTVMRKAVEAGLTMLGVGALAPLETTRP